MPELVFKLLHITICKAVQLESGINYLDLVLCTAFKPENVDLFLCLILL